MTYTRRLGRILCIFWPSKPSQPFQEIVNHKETTSPRQPVMKVILKHMTGPTGKMKNSTIVTKEAIHLLIFQKRRRKRTTVTSSSPVNKVKPVLKKFTNIRIRLRRSSPHYKLRQKSLKRTNLKYQTHMESHKQIDSLYWMTTNRFWNPNITQTNRLSSTTAKRRDPYKIS